MSAQAWDSESAGAPGLAARMARSRDADPGDMARVQEAGAFSLLPQQLWGVSP